MRPVETAAALWLLSWVSLFVMSGALIAAVAAWWRVKRLDTRLRRVHRALIELERKTADSLALMEGRLQATIREMPAARVVLPTGHLADPPAAPLPERVSPAVGADAATRVVLSEREVVDAWREWTADPGGGLEVCVDRLVPGALTESLTTGDERPKLFVVYAGTEDTNEGWVVPRGYENWFAEVFSEWFEADAASPRKGVVVDLVSPARARRQGGRWNPTKRGIVLVKQFGR